MKYLLVFLLLTACSGKQTYLDPRPVGRCLMIQEASAKFYKVAGLDSRGYILRELVLTDAPTQSIVEYSYLRIVNKPLTQIMECKEAEAFMRELWATC